MHPAAYFSIWDLRRSGCFPTSGEPVVFCGEFDLFVCSWNVLAIIYITYYLVARRKVNNNASRHFLVVCQKALNRTVVNPAVELLWWLAHRSLNTLTQILAQHEKMTVQENSVSFNRLLFNQIMECACLEPGIFIIHREDVARTKVDASLQTSHSNTVNLPYPNEYAPGNKLSKKEAKELNRQSLSCHIVDCEAGKSHNRREQHTKQCCYVDAADMKEFYLVGDTIAFTHKYDEKEFRPDKAELAQHCNILPKGGVGLETAWNKFLHAPWRICGTGKSLEVPSSRS